MKVLILAAGYATRLKAYTENTPKALLALGKYTLLERLLQKIDEMPGITERILVTNHRFADQFHAWQQASGYPIRIIDDGTTADNNKLGAIGDIQFVLDTVGNTEDWFIAACDNLFEFSLLEVYASYVAHEKKTLLSAVEIQDKHRLKGLAVAQVESGKILSLIEKPQEPASNLGVFALYFYPQEVLDLIPQYLEEGGSPDAPGFFPAWLHKKQDVYCHICSGPIYDVGTVEEYEQLAMEYAQAGK